MTDQIRYDYDFVEGDPHSTAAAVYSLLRERPRILDLGSGPAVVSSRAARELGAEVVCVDSDEDALLAAAGRGVAATILADLAARDWLDAVAGGSFDTVILADVLEHLYDPRQLLAAVLEAGLVAEGGEFVISFPNASHEAIIGSLAVGDFEYQEKGILDATHIRWFTLKSMRRLLDSVGLSIDKVLRIERTIEQTALDYVLADLDDELRRLVRERAAESSVYQYVLTARRAVGSKPSDSAADARRDHAVDKAAIARLQGSLEAAHRQRDEATAALVEHEHRAEDFEHRMRDLKGRINDLEQLLRDERTRYAFEQQKAAESQRRVAAKLVRYRDELSRTRRSAARYKRLAIERKRLAIERKPDALRYRRIERALRRTGLYGLARAGWRALAKVRRMAKRGNRAA